MSALAYPTLVFVHVLLFVMWLGADAGVFLLGQHFRRRARYSLEQRLALLTLLVEVDMVPRTAWALMVPISLSVVRMGGYWAIPSWLLISAWLIGAVWLWLVWDAHLHDRTARAARNRRIEFWLKIALAAAYLGLGIYSLGTGGPLAPRWLASKALMFGIIFVAAIMIDVAFRPVGPQLAELIANGSSDATELPLLRTMNCTRLWVWAVYLLLIATAYLGLVKPF
jgi:hypothetical protein